MFYVFWILIWQGRKYAKHLGPDVHRAYLVCGILTLIVWLCYPICWGVADGGNIIAVSLNMFCLLTCSDITQPDSEAVFYGVLDMLAKPFFSMALLFFHRKIDPARLGLKFRDYDDDFAYHYDDHHRLHQPEHKEETPSEGVPRVSRAAEGTTNGTHETTTTTAA